MNTLGSAIDYQARKKRQAPRIRLGKISIIKSLRLRIISAFLALALIVITGYSVTLKAVSEGSQDIEFNWYIAKVTDTLVKMHYANPEMLKKYLNGRLVMGDDRQAQRYLADHFLPAEMAITEFDGDLTSLPYIDSQVEVTKQGYSIFEVEFNGREMVHIVRAPLTGKNDTSPYLYYFADTSGFSVSPDQELELCLVQAIGAGITLLLAVLAAVLLTRFVMAPLRQLKQDMERLDIQRSQKLDTDYYHDEVGSVACHINQLVDRIREGIVREKAFIRDVSHELRTPVTAIAMTVENVQDEPLPETSVLKKGLRRIARANTNMARLIEAFTVLGRESSIKEESVHCDMYTLANASIDLNGGIHAPENVRMINVVPKDLYMRLPPKLLSILGENLIRTACQHDPDGKIWLDAGHTWIEIRHSGPGFDQAVISNLARPYCTEKSNGFGLGLNIVQRICQTRNWKLDIANWKQTDDSGAAIRVTFA
ncbi:histidine kinase dimerization/phospho-acceptor domain-containing protein [Endozoicomonadaceae bacterium StTr2]